MLIQTHNVLFYAHLGHFAIVLQLDLLCVDLAVHCGDLGVDILLSVSMHTDSLHRGCVFILSSLQVQLGFGKRFTFAVKSRLAFIHLGLKLVQLLRMITQPCFDFFCLTLLISEVKFSLNKVKKFKLRILNELHLHLKLV